MVGGSTRLARVAAQLRARWLLVALLTVLPTRAVHGQNAYSEEVVKALLLERIVTFLVWAEPPADKAPLQVVVLGDSALGDELERLFEKRLFAGHPMSLRHVARAAEVGDPDIVIIGREHGANLGSVLKVCAHPGVLTVGDGPGFGANGVAINFIREDSRVRFELRPSALKDAHIQPSYKLLSLARVVGGP